VPKGESSTAIKMAKHVSGWNMYMSEQMKVLKETIKPSTDRLKKIGANWKALPQGEKDVWNAQAKALAPVPELVVPIRKGRISGYNIYMREQTKVLKEQVKDGKDRLKRIGASWKMLSKVEQGVWNTQAKAVLAM